jgi:protocatechuate 3,4-dioxygenase, beta subunit
MDEFYKIKEERMSDQAMVNSSRRRFVKSASVAALMFPAMPLGLLKCGGSAESNLISAQAKIVGGACDGCELIYQGMPQQLSWQTKINPASEAGEAMEITGVIYQADGKSPAPDIILYVYHTDAQGYYSPARDQPEVSRRHGHLRGWMKTDASGQYKFTSIKPAPYPQMYDPAHIHPTIKEPDKNEYYIDEYRFDDDPLITREYRARAENRGGSGIIQLTKNDKGIWIGKRDIVLGQNVPNYK